MNLSEKDICSICDDLRRDKASITVVESPLDLVSFEKGKIYNGLYHVLHGRIDPLNNIGPEDIFVNQLIERVKKICKEDPTNLKEIILATNPDMEGEATAMFIRKRLEEVKNESTKNTNGH